MRRSGPCSGLSIFAVLFALTAGPAWAAEIDGYHPPCCAPGDLFYVQGVHFTERPVVTLGDQRVEVIRRRAGALLCRVPQELAEGRVELRVDGARAPVAFEVLAPGRPVVHGLSATVGTRGQAVLGHGRRLQGGRVSFVNPQGGVAATVDLEGGRRAVVLRVPPTLAPGTYTLVFTNGNGLTTGECSPRFEVVGSGEPALCAIHPAGAIPSRIPAAGQRIRCVGTDLGPMGRCRVHWTDATGGRTTAWGRSNGYDVVRLSVPARLKGGEPYEVTVELRNGKVTPAVAWTPARGPAPSAPTIDPPVGPPGCCLAVQAADLFAYGTAFQVKLSSPRGTQVADLVYRHPGGLGHGAAWIVRPPDDLAEGAYKLTLRAANRTSAAATYRVAEVPFAVTGLWPARQSEAGTDRPIVVEGSGFGSGADAANLRVVWADGVRTRDGAILFRTERALRVLPPGGTEDPLHPGTWTVSVIRSRSVVTRMERAGTYTVTGGD